ncbi:hypothetical protein OKW21_004058 [Catalinimonas alkaloidigena]|uniref:sialate O-acetylesterase n=1 Tax=Catalinimonas alkaloidigena TaxID=1075417 RepID=UPI0024066FA7|nr:sialate O-acetylesterase [Catalinimonas alkaloidigena]MDF9798795.1 hypothetical protein [Catalinimonas alkaloidigena]
MKAITLSYLPFFWTLLLFSGYNLFSQQNPVGVYLIGGQFNATGQGYLVNLPPNVAIDTSVMIFHSHLLKGKAPYTWQPLYQASETPDKFGVELSLGTRLQEHYHEQKVALIKHAYSGPNLYEDWYLGENKEDTAHSGKQFRYFVDTVEEGLAQLRHQGFSPEVKGMFWQQGEGDARDIAGLVHSENYGQNLNHFIKRVRQQFGVRKMLFVYGHVIPVHRDRLGGRPSVAVRSGQFKLIEFYEEKARRIV